MRGRGTQPKQQPFHLENHQVFSHNPTPTLFGSLQYFWEAFPARPHHLQVHLPACHDTPNVNLPPHTPTLALSAAFNTSGRHSLLAVAPQTAPPTCSPTWTLHPTAPACTKSWRTTGSSCPSKGVWKEVKMGFERDFERRGGGGQRKGLKGGHGVRLRLHCIDGITSSGAREGRSGRVAGRAWCLSLAELY